LRSNISESFLRRSQVFIQKGDDILIFHASAKDFGDWNSHPFLKRIACIDGWRSPNVHAMKNTANKCYKLALAENRPDHRNIVEVSGAMVAII
jgi:hypothetical protein